MNEFFLVVSIFILAIIITTAVFIVRILLSPLVLIMLVLKALSNTIRFIFTGEIEIDDNQSEDKNKELS
jgi:hypothetical protein